MSIEKNYEMLFTSIQHIVDEQPQSVPQLLAIILAGGPFRPFLEKPELLNKVLVMAKQYVADKKREGAKQATGTRSGPTTTTKVPKGGRVMSVRDIARPQGPSKA